MRKISDLRMKLLRYAGMAVMMLACFAMFSLSAYAAEGKVTASAAKIRKDASTSSEAMGSAVNGQTFTISGEKTGSDGKVWYQVTYDGNKTGYIRSDLMEKIGEVTPSITISPTVPVEAVQPVSAKIVGNTVRVRADASTQGGIIANVLKDTVVTINGRAQDSQNKTWYRVNYSSDSGEVNGFIRYDFLTVSGEIKPVEDTPVVEPPKEDEKPSEGQTEDPSTTTPLEVKGKYYITEKDGEWYLVDKEAGYQYNAEDLVKAALDNPKAFEKKDKKIKSQKSWIIILVILVVALGAAVVFLFRKMREVMDDAYFAAVEKETIRQRQGQKANNPGSANRNKNVMHTVGAGAPKGGQQGKTAGTRPAGAGGQQRPAGAGGQQRPVGQQRPAGAGGQQRPANPQNKPVSAQPKPANPNNPVAAKTVAPTPKTVAQKPAEEANKQTWQSKNFAADDDDEFEFEFLNWDGSEEE